MARRSDPRPPVEILDQQGADEPPARVRVGGGGPRRRWGAVVVVLAVIALVVGLVLDDDGGDDGSTADDEPAGTAAPPAEAAEGATTGTSVVGAGEVPVFGAPAGASLLIGSEGGGWRLLDLDTGALTEVPALDGVPAGAMAPVRDGVVVLDPARGGAPSIVDLPSGERAPLRIRFQAPPARISSVTGVLPSGLDDHVWVTMAPSGGPPHPDATPQAVLVRLDGEVEMQLELRRQPVLGTASGIVVAVGGRTYLQDPAGTRPLGTGTPHAATATEVALLTCDDDALCGTQVVDVATGEPRAAMPLPDVSESELWLGLHDDGSLAALPASPGVLRAGALTGGAGSVLLHVHEPGEPVRSVEIPSVQSTPVWLPGDLGLALLTGYGLVRYVDEGGGYVGHRVDGLRTASDRELVLVPRSASR